MKKILGKIGRFFNLELNCLYDYIRFKKYYSSDSDTSKNKKNLEAWILQDKHRIEKGLSLPYPRYFFGELVLKRLFGHLCDYNKQWGKDRVYYIGLGAFKAYEEFHKNGQKELPDFFIKIKSTIEAEDFLEPTCELVGLGDIVISDGKFIDFFEEFSLSRHSCRNYDTNKKITPDLIKKIMKLTIKAPSVYNRQHWQAHFFSGDMKNEILSFQNGNVGFTENIPYIAVITSDLGYFYTAHERNQPFVDGGIFSMNLMYAMHSYGIASCALNWCNSFHSDQSFLNKKYIKKSETVVMLLAFGYPNKSGSFAKSPRMDVSRFYTIN